MSRQATLSGLLQHHRLTVFRTNDGDSVAAKAMNDFGHSKAWYAIVAIGAVCHAANRKGLPLGPTAKIDKTRLRSELGGSLA